MNAWARNFPAPLPATMYGDVGFSGRGEVVAALCRKTNEVLEFFFGLEAKRVPVPGQAAGSDERMPLLFLRPCIDELNYLVNAGDFDMTMIIVAPGDNMDYHAFTPLVRSIVATINGIIGALRG